MKWKHRCVKDTGYDILQMRGKEMEFLEIDKPFEFPAYRLNSREKLKIEHEINTNYAKYNGQEFCVHYSYGLDNRSYKYFFENHGFNKYNFYDRKYNSSRRR